MCSSLWNGSTRVLTAAINLSMLLTPFFLSVNISQAVILVKLCAQVIDSVGTVNSDISAYVTDFVCKTLVNLVRGCERSGLCKLLRLQNR